MDNVKPVMVTLQTACKMYDWKPDTVREWMENGEFVTAYRQGKRRLAFNVADLEKFAHREPIDSKKASLISSEI